MTMTYMPYKNVPWSWILHVAQCTHLSCINTAGKCKLQASQSHGCSLHGQCRDIQSSCEINVSKSIGAPNSKAEEPGLVNARMRNQHLQKHAYTCINPPLSWYPVPGTRFFARAGLETRRYGTPNATKIRKSTSEFRKSIIVFTKSTSEFRKSIIVFTKSISEFGKSIIVFAKSIVVFAKSITEFDYRVCKIDLSCLQNRFVVFAKSIGTPNATKIRKSTSEFRKSIFVLPKSIVMFPLYTTCCCTCLCMHLHLSNLYYSITSTLIPWLCRKSLSMSSYIAWEWDRTWPHLNVNKPREVYFTL